MSEASVKIRDLAKTHLDSRGRPDAVFEEAILARETGNLGPAPMPRSGTDVLLRSVQPNLLPRADRHTIVREFRAHLAKYHLSEQTIEAYATAFNHHGKFVLVRTDAEHAALAMQILQDFGATRVNRHD
jgi:hypothetical protein